MLITTEYIDPVELTGYVREAFADLQINQFTLSRFLPNDPIDDLDYRLARGGAGLAEAAEFRAYDTESPLGARQGFQRISGELPPISQKIRLAEYDRLRQRRATGQVVRDYILGDAERLARGISARMEIARGEALVTGAVTIEENGLALSVDFGRRAQHAVAPTVLWSAVDADPLADLLSWQDTYRITNGEPPGSLLMSTRIFSVLMRNPAMRNLVYPGANQPGIVSREAVNAVLTAFSLPGIEVYDAQVSVSRAAQRVIPDDRVLMLPRAGTANNPRSTQLGATFWGTTAESLEPEFGLAGNEPGLVSGSYSDSDPVALWTKAAAIGLPALANPDLSLVADVL